MERILIAALVLLGGCTSYAGIQSKEPSLVAQSAKTPDAFVGCAYPALLNKVAIFNSVRLVPDGEARSLTITDLLGTTNYASITATPDSGGSTVAFRGWWPDVKACL